MYMYRCHLSSLFRLCAAAFFSHFQTRAVFRFENLLFALQCGIVMRLSLSSHTTAAAAAALKTNDVVPCIQSVFLCRTHARSLFIHSRSTCTSLHGDADTLWFLLRRSEFRRFGTSPETVVNSESVGHLFRTL